MLPVNFSLNNSANINRNKNYSPNFNGITSPQEGKELLTIMPTNAKRLIKKLNNFLENEWKEIKNNRSGFYEKPYYTLSGKKNEVATVTPIYIGRERDLLFEISKDGVTERMIINRDNPDSFKYEKVVETEFGSATTKSFNSAHERNKTLEALVGEHVVQFIPQILASKIFY